MCTPCRPMVCYKYEDNGPEKEKDHDESSKKVDEGGKEKKKDREIQLKKIKSRELRGGIMYYSCQCIKRNGLQHDCRRTGCCGEPPCLVLPDPMCLPSQLARARGLADPAPLAKFKQGKASSGATSKIEQVKPSKISRGSGKRFIVCEMKVIVPEESAETLGICSKCHKPFTKDISKVEDPNKYCTCLKDQQVNPPEKSNTNKCTWSTSIAETQSILKLDEKTLEYMLKQIETKEHETKEAEKNVPSEKLNAKSKPVEETFCMRPGCVHWRPPAQCVWDLPCKADCFETLPGVHPNNLLNSSLNKTSEKQNISYGEYGKAKVKILTAAECSVVNPGPSKNGNGIAASENAPLGSGIPVLIMKLCN